VPARRGREETVCARGANRALLGGPSTSPLESATKTHLETHEELGAGAEDPSLDGADRRATIGLFDASSNNRWSGP